MKIIIAYFLGIITGILITYLLIYFFVVAPMERRPQVPSQQEILAIPY